MIKRILIASAVIAITMNSTWAQTKRIECKKTGNDTGNTQCVYDVSNNGTQEKLYAMSKMPYALCSKAKCMVSSTDVHTAICYCPVFGFTEDWQGVSVGPHDYQISQPVKKNEKWVSVVSNFSFANSESKLKQPETCQFAHETAWANCFGVRCQIHSTGNNGDMMATCQCPIIKTKSFISMGPENPGQCGLLGNEVWSAATATTGANNNDVMQDMYKHYYPESS